VSLNPLPQDDRPDDTLDAQMMAEIEAADGELLGLYGPDAWTSDRAHRLTQFKSAQAAERANAVEAAERANNLVGYLLAAFRRERDWSQEQLADWLGLDIEAYGRLATTVRPAVVTRHLEYDRGLVEQFAERFGAHPARLIQVFDESDP
jgi:hypothetical protein